MDATVVIYQTYVVGYASHAELPRVGANMTVMGGKLVAVQFSNALRELELLIDRSPEETLRAVYSIMEAESQTPEPRVEA